MCDNYESSTLPRTCEQGAEEECGSCQNHNIAWCREINGYRHKGRKVCDKYKARVLPTTPEEG